jgi:hypothetical protein
LGLGGRGFRVGYSGRGDSRVNLCSASHLDGEATGGWGMEGVVDVGLDLGLEDDPETELNGGRSSPHWSE